MRGIEFERLEIFIGIEKVGKIYKTLSSQFVIKVYVLFIILKIDLKVLTYISNKFLSKFVLRKRLFDRICLSYNFS